jgi:hypothetical protein
MSAARDHVAVTTPPNRDNAAAGSPEEVKAPATAGRKRATAGKAGASTKKAKQEACVVKGVSCACLL